MDMLHFLHNTSCDNHYHNYHDDNFTIKTTLYIVCVLHCIHSIIIVYNANKNVIVEILTAEIKSGWLRNFLLKLQYLMKPLI